MLSFLMNHPFAVSFFLVAMASLILAEKIVLANKGKKVPDDNGSFLVKGVFFLFVFSISLVLTSVFIDSSIGRKSETLKKYLKEGKISESMMKDVILSPFDQLRETFAQNSMASPEYLMILLNDESTIVQDKARANLQIKQKIEVDPYSFQQELFGKITILLFCQFFFIFVFVARIRAPYKYFLGATILAMIISSYLYMQKDFSMESSQVNVLSALVDAGQLSPEATQKWIQILLMGDDSKNSNFIAVFARKSDKLDTASLKLLMIKNLNPFDRSFVMSELIKRKEITFQTEETPKPFLEDLNFRSIW